MKDTGTLPSHERQARVLDSFFVDSTHLFGLIALPRLSDNGRVVGKRWVEFTSADQRSNFAA